MSKRTTKPITAATSSLALILREYTAATTLRDKLQDDGVRRNAYELRALAEADDRRDVLMAMASYEIPHSATEAAFLVNLLDADVDNLRSSDWDDRDHEKSVIERRTSRYAFAILRYLKGAGSMLPSIILKYHMADHLDPIPDLESVRTDGC
jgi:hypothetical protein